MKQYVALLLSLLLLTACGQQSVPEVQGVSEEGVSPSAEQQSVAEEPVGSSDEEDGLKLKPFDDIRVVFNEKQVFEEWEYRSEDIATFIFNEGTVLKGNQELQRKTMENGKNPGLGVRALHEQGITGEGVNVAIIDQNLLLHHPEFDGKIAAYYDTGCEQPASKGSMHAPAVTSILVGNTVGVAPGTRVYYAAAPSWTGDSEFYAKGLYWIINENKKLPDGEKIRVVSVSASPSGAGSPFTENQSMWDEAVLTAQNEGILVLDCRLGMNTGIIMPAYYNPADPENVDLCRGGFPSSEEKFKFPIGKIGAPTSYRTVAEEYYESLPINMTDRAG